MINTALIYIITTDQHHHDHQQYNDNHHDHDDDDQEHPARAGQREDGEQEVQQPEPDHVEPFCPGRFFVAIFITNIVYVIYTCIIDCISSPEPGYDNLGLDKTQARPTWSTALRARTAAAC